MRPPARIRTDASSAVLEARRDGLADLLAAAGHPRDRQACGLILATILGHGSWTSLLASARRETRPDPVDGALGIDALELRLEEQVTGLLHRIPDLDHDGDAAQRLVAELGASCDPAGPFATRGPCTGPTHAYRGRGNGTALFLARESSRTVLFIVDAARDPIGRIVAAVCAAVAETDRGPTP